MVSILKCSCLEGLAFSEPKTKRRFSLQNAERGWFFLAPGGVLAVVASIRSLREKKTLRTQLTPNFENPWSCALVYTPLKCLRRGILV